MATTAWKKATAGANDNSEGARPWSNPGRVTADDGSITPATTSGADALTQRLVSTFDADLEAMGVDPGDTTTQIDFRFERNRSGTGAGESITDEKILLLVDGVATGSNLADTGTNWPTSATVTGIYSFTGLSLDSTSQIKVVIMADIRKADLGESAASIDYTEARATHEPPPAAADSASRGLRGRPSLNKLRRHAGRLWSS